MLRNYVVPGAALIFIAIFAAPGIAPPAAPNGLHRREMHPARTPILSQTTPTGIQSEGSSAPPQVEEGKPLFDPQKVCDFASYEMHEKLSGFGLTSTGTDAADTPGPSAEAMIALVPDPVHTHLALLFDRTVGTIQEALQDPLSADSAGWIYTGQWLPWDPVSYQTPDNPIERTNTRTFDIERECAPGFLIFRTNRLQGGNTAGKFLVVFLVGESPTSGILNQNEFLKAVVEWRQIEARDPDLQKKQTLRILGPSFSASLPTLDSLLSNRLCSSSEASSIPNCVPQAQVISGAAAASPKVVYEHFAALKRAGFVSMNESALGTEELLLSYLRSAEGVQPDEVAFLSEDQTAYGTFLSSAFSPPEEGKKKDGDKPLLFHFPREISQLRNAYEQNTISSRTSSNEISNAANPSLRLSLEDRHEEEDSVPAFAESQDPISEELILSGITRAMDRRNVRVAVINATDVLDVIFVAGFLHRNVPNVGVILMNADLMFLQSSEVSSFRGMLTVNTYPLIPENAMWSGRFLGATGDLKAANIFGNFLPERIFSSFDAPGTYNAVRLLEVAPFRKTSENPYVAGIQPVRGDLDSLWLREYSDPFRGGYRPSLWLNTIGRGGFWPIALLDHVDQSPTSVPRVFTTKKIDGKDASNPDSIPLGMFDRGLRLGIPRLVAVCIALVFVLAGIALCLFANLQNRPQYFFGIPGTNSERRAWIILAILLCFSWIIRLLMLDLPLLAFFQDPINCVLVLTEVILAGFWVWLIKQALHTRKRFRVAVSLMLATATTQALFHWVLPVSDFSSRIFYLYRSEHLLSGAAPPLPFILLTIALICLISRHLQALFIFSAKIKPRLPCYGGAQSPAILQPVNCDAVSDILQSCYSPWRLLYQKHKAPDALGSRRVLLVLFTIAIGLLVFASSFLLLGRLHTLETRPYSWCLTIFTQFIALILVHEAWWVALMWLCLRKGLLVPLERTTLRTCFNRVSGFPWHRLWLAVDLSLAARYKPLVRALESLRLICLDPFCPQEVRAMVGDVDQKHDDILKSVTPELRIESFEAYQNSLCQCATEVIRRILSDPQRQKIPFATSTDLPAKKLMEVLERAAEADSLEASAEEFVGLIYVYAIQHVLMDIRSHVFAFVFGYFFLVLALNVYPVGPHHSVMAFLIGLFVLFLSVIAFVFMAMHRDSILSRTTATEPGKLDAGFFAKLVSVVSVPLIGLLASLFPELSNFLFSWLEPGLQAFK